MVGVAEQEHEVEVTISDLFHGEVVIGQFQLEFGGEGRDALHVLYH